MCRYRYFVLDLGALLNYRLNGGDVVSTAPNSSFRQLFASGLFVSLAMTRTIPLNVLWGVQLLPSARSVSTSTVVVTRSAVRLGVNVGLDVMLSGF